MANGEFNTVPAPGWGEFEIETKEKVLSVIADKDINFLDYNRGNNVYPGQITPTWSDQYLLKQGEAMLLGIRPYLAAGIDTQTLEIGLDFFNRDSRSFFISPIIQMPLAYDSAIPMEEQFNIGGAMELGLKFPGHTGLTLSLLYLQPDIFESLSITLSKQFFFDNDIGYSAHYYYPNLSISSSTRISGLTGSDFTTGSLSQIISGFKNNDGHPYSPWIRNQFLFKCNIGKSIGKRQLCAFIFH